MPASVLIAMEEGCPRLLLPRSSAIAVSFFYCTVNHGTFTELNMGYGKYYKKDEPYIYYYLFPHERKAAP
eukprot:scaffold305133_cov68-Attheya_sp.AAC.4